MEKLIRFLQKLFADGFYGTITIRFESGKATHVEMNSTRKWEYKDLPDGNGKATFVRALKDTAGV